MLSSLLRVVIFTISNIHDINIDISISIASNAGSSVSVIMPTIFSIYPVAIWRSDTRYQTA